MKSHIHTLAHALMLGSAAIALLPTAAFAQANQTGKSEEPVPSVEPANQTPDQVAAADTANQDAGGQAIVVTGTLIRGIAPAGNNVIGITPEQIASSGGTTTNQILTSLPQVANFFNGMPAGVSNVAGANGSNPISRPNLRNLPGANTSGGAQTLVLLDGRRIVGAGTQQVAVDPDIIAPGVIQRVEALTDGGSAVYGSDALGGVLNFVTRRKFDGVQLNIRGGLGEDFKTVDGSAMVGKTWDTGGIYVAYGYAHHDAVYGSDRDFVRRIDYNTGVPTGRNCATPNVTVGGTSYVPSGNGIARGGPNVCDYSDDLAIYPRNTLHTVFSRFVQDLSPAIHVDITALYAKRTIVGQGGTLGTGALGSGATATATLTATNPSYRPLTGAQAGLPQTVLFNYAPLFGARSAGQRTTLDTLSIDPSFSVDLGSGWQIRNEASYGRSITRFTNDVIVPARQAAAIANGTLNPYNVGATNATVASGLLGLDRGLGRNELFDARSVIDGPLFNLPGGAVRAALGYEHMHDNFRRQISNTTTFALLPAVNYTQKVDSVFGELQIPLIAKDNESALGSELTLSASARYDKYSDFGDTFNPKFGATYRPIEWIAIRGNWGKSFTAPSPVDQLGGFTSSASLVPAAFLQVPNGITLAPGETGVFLGGGTAAGLQPQKATNWSIGAELKPPFIEGLTLSASYYHIALKGTIGRPVSGANLAPFFASYPGLFLVRPTGQQLAAFIAARDPATVNYTLLNPTATTQAVVSSGGNSAPVALVLDTLVRNLGNTNLSGIDFAANYIYPTGFGSLDASIAGNYQAKQKTKPDPNGTLVINDLLTEIPRFRVQGTVGATVGKLRAQVIWNHTSGYHRGDAGTAGAYGQVRVKAFDQINLFARYEVPASLVGPDFDVTLNVQNLFDVSPPLFLSATQNGYDTNGIHAFTIGRVVQLGLAKKF